MPPRLETLIHMIPLANADNPEGIALLLNMATALKAKLKQAEADLELRMLAEIERTGQDIIIGPVRYYAGTAKVTKCVNTPGLVEALLTKTGGDLDVIASMMASQPWKHGEVKGLLGEDEWAKYFRVDWKTELKEGVPTRKTQLLSIDERFIKRAAATDNTGPAPMPAGEQE